jgi:hypothetical protein
MSDNPIGGLVDAVTEAWEEGKAEAAKRNVQLFYWPKLIERFSYSPQNFYALVMKAVSERQVPGFEPRHIMLRQGGPLSPRRLYLQFRRERMFIEICGFQFGTGFFVSERVFDRRPYGPVFKLLFGLFLFGLISVGVASKFGWLWGLVSFIGLVTLVWSLMRMASANVADTLDLALSDLPGIGAVYLWLFHSDTYFRQDTNRAYQEAVHRAVMAAVDEMGSQKGLRSLSEEERKPFIEDLHMR